MKELKKLFWKVIFMAATVIITTLLQQQSTNTIFIIIGFVISAIFAFLLAYQMVRVSRWYGEKDRIIEEEDKKKEEIRQKGECVKKLKDLLSTDKTFGFYQILRHINKELDHDSMLLDLSTQCHVLSGINIETTYHYIPYILEKLQPFINIIADSKIEKKEMIAKTITYYNSILDKITEDGLTRATKLRKLMPQ